jgi:hypothetical protein
MAPSCSVVGIPGGVSGQLYPALEAAAARRGVVLRAGAGSDADTLGTGEVWVLDSAAFPFRAAELYHQFHGQPSGLPLLLPAYAMSYILTHAVLVRADGFMPGEQYPRSYHALRATALQRGLIQPTGCPEL